VTTNVLSVVALSLLSMFGIWQYAERPTQPPFHQKQLNSGGGVQLNNVGGGEGERLAGVYCATCHVLPKPEHLDQATWLSKVFPTMRRYMGLDQLPHREKLPHDLESFFPIHPLITEDEWFKIALYFVDNAPLELPTVVIPNASVDTTVFDVQEIRLGIVPPMTTLVKFDSATKQLIIGDGFTNELRVCTLNGDVKHTIKLDGPPSGIAIEPDAWYVTDMGKLLPHDSAIGSIKKIVWKNGSPTVTTIVKNLRRPTHIIAADLNNDGIRDFVVCEYGNLLGQLGWFEVKRNRRFVYHELLAQPGAIRTQIADLNSDGKPDIIAQMAQAREGLFAYINKGKGLFESQELITLPPSFGSSWFGFTDWNHDSYPDIILTTGDNGDYDNPPNKPYHGVYVYVGSKEMKYSQVEFYPMYGAYGAAFENFSLASSKDMFVFSYFPNLSDSLVGLVRLYNELPDASRVLTYSKSTSGRWLVFDVADVDGDGDTDIVLGNVSYGPANIPDEIQKGWVEGGVSALVLKNNLRK